MCTWVGWLAATMLTAVAAEPVAAEDLDTRVEELIAAREYATAQTLVEENLALAREALPAGHVDLAEPLAEAARVLYIRATYAEARPLLEESLAIRRKAHGARHPLVGEALHDLAEVLTKLGDYSGARVLLDQSLDIRREALGSRHLHVADTLDQLAEVMRLQGQALAAFPLMAESLGIIRETHAPDHPTVAISMMNMAGFHFAQGDYPAARALLEESVTIARKAKGSDHPDVAAQLNNLALVVKSQGDYVAARRLYEESLAIRRAAFGPRDTRVGATLSNLGVLLASQGDDAAAYEILSESLDIQRAALGPMHPRVAPVLGSVANALLDMGDFDAAHAKYEECLVIQRETLPPLHPQIAATLNNLGLALRGLDDFEGSDARMRESLAIRRELFGSGHPEVSNSLLNVAKGLHIAGDYDSAKPLLDESLDIVRAVYGSRHPAVAAALRALATNHNERGDIDTARRLHEEALAIVEEHLELLDALSEREALAFLQANAIAVDGWLHVFARPEEAATGWEHALRFKGAVAARARSARTLASVDAGAAAVAAELDGVRRELAALAFADVEPEERAAKADRLASMTAERERLERDLQSLSAGFDLASSARNATPAALCEALPNDAALIDLLRYEPLYGSARYLAFIQQMDCQVQRVELGPAQPLEDAAREWHQVLRDPKSSSDRVDKRGRALAAILLEPLVAVAGERAHWLVVPDGTLATIPFGALPTRDGYAVEERLITYLDQASDVLERPAAAGIGALVSGGIDYDSAARSGGEARSFLAPCNGGRFAPLPGTEAEVDLISRHWVRSKKREPLSTLEGAAATESAISSALEGKALAHIATHGFFATGDCKSALHDGVGYDPMLLSGLVLSGANLPPDPSSPEDGILTASEVATLDLSDTKLVVLSACETGLGEVQSGQGVLGLRRAFAIAGARALLMSLWSVPDEETALLMDEMYKRHLKRRGMSAAEALRAAQLEILTRQRKAGTEHPYEWAAFIASGDWRP